MDTQSQIKAKIEFAIVNQFKWVDKFGQQHLIDDMETRHLFHVVRMIWDHSMPREWQTSYKRRYIFPEFYNIDYMSLAVRLILPALLHRKDLTPEMMYWLNFMEECLKNKRMQIPFILKIGYERALAS